MYLAKYGKQHPLVSEFAFQIFSSLQMAKALIVKHKEPRPAGLAEDRRDGQVHIPEPVPLRADVRKPDQPHGGHLCVDRQDRLEAERPYHATYDNSTWITSCMHNVLPEAQAKKLTKNPGVPEAAIKFFYSHAKAVN